MIKSVSLILPAKNEEKKIEKTVVSCYRLLERRKFTFEIIAVVNGSTDSTARIVKKLCKNLPKLRLIEEKGKIYKGGAVKLGFNGAKYECVGFMDSDDTFTDASILKVLDAFYKNEVSAVVAKKSYKSAKRKILSDGLCALTLILFGLKNTQTGLKLFKKSDVMKTLPLKEKGWIFDVEILWKIKKSGKKIMYVPIVLRKNSEGSFSNLDMLKMLRGLIKIKLMKIN